MAVAGDGGVPTQRGGDADALPADALPADVLAQAVPTDCTGDHAGTDDVHAGTGRPVLAGPGRQVPALARFSSLRFQPVDVHGTQDAWLASVLRSLDVAVMSSSTDGRIRSWNTGAEALLGYEAEEVLGRPATVLVAPEDRLATAALLARLFRGERVAPFETLRVRKDGVAIRVSILLAPVRDRVGRVVGACAVMREVGGGGWLQAELDALTKDMDVVVVVLDSELRPISTSASIERVFGSAPDDWLAGRVVHAVHPDDATRTAATFEQWLAAPGLSGAPVEYRIRHRDGSWLWVESFAHNLLDDPDVQGLVVTTWDVTERREAARDRAVATSRLTAMFDQAVIPQIVLGLDRTVLEANAALCAMIGYRAEEMVGRRIDEFAVTEDAEVPRAMWDDLVAGRVPSIDFERRYRRKDGSILELYTRTALVRDNEGRPLYAAGIGTDRTERNTARRALERSEARRRALIENSRDLFVVLDASSIVTYVSPGVGCMLGYEPDELVGRQPTWLVHPDDHEALTDEYAAVLAAGSGRHPETFVFRACTAQGAWRHLEAVATNLIDDPAVGGVLLNVRDVTERQRSLEALTDSEARYRTIVETAQEGIWMVDPLNRITFANGALARLLRCSPDELLGRSPVEFMGPQWRRPVSPGGVRPFTCVPGEEIRFLAFDGTEVWATVSTSPLVGPAGEVTGGLAMISDVTGRRTADIHLRQSEERFRSLVQYASDVAVIATPEGTVTYATPGAEQFLGSHETLEAGFNILDRLHPDDLGAVSEVLAEVLGDRRPFEERVPRLVRCRARHVDGSWHVVEATLSNLLDLPAVGGIVVNVRDIDEVTAATVQMEESQRRFESLVKHSTDVILVVDPFGMVTYVSPSLEQVLGYRPEDLLGRRTRDLVHPDDVGSVVDLMAGLRRACTLPAKAEIRVRDRQGSYLRVEVVGNNLLDDPAVGGMVFNVRDVSERVRSEHELRSRAAQQAAVGWLSQRALVTVELQPLFDDAVKTVAEVLGIEIVGVMEADGERGDIVVRSMSGLPEGSPLIERSRPGSGGLAEYTLKVEEPVLVESLAEETRFVPRPEFLDAGVQSSAGIVIPGPHGRFGALVAHSRARRAFTGDDLTFLSAVANVLGSAVQRHTYEQRLTYQATYDVLTGLPNRALLLDRLRLALSRRTPGRVVGLLFIGLDRFKLVNDAYSHELGDAVLSAVGDRLWSHVRPADTVARFGGDEFVVLCDDLTREEEAVELAERVLSTLASPFEVGGEQVNLTASVGICLATGQQDAETMLAEADAAMVEAKARGRGRWELFDVSFRHRIMARLQLESDLRSAVENDELTLQFQPLVRLDTGEVTGVECLLRWDHPVRGRTMPDKFVPVAEDTGAIIAIGAWTLHAACAQAARWQAAGRGPLAVSVNLSSRQLDEPTLPDLVAEALGAHGLEPRWLCLEITESAIMRDASQALAVLEALKELGVRIAIDDFGTGYSSLAYLRRFPVDVLKIDGSFVQGLGEDPEDSAIVAAVLRLAETLGVDVVAEGVETAGQLDTLRALGCQFGQGYFFSRPVAAEEI